MGQLAANWMWTYIYTQIHRERRPLSLCCTSKYVLNLSPDLKNTICKTNRSSLFHDHRFKTGLYMSWSILFGYLIRVALGQRQQIQDMTVVMGMRMKSCMMHHICKFKWLVTVELISMKITIWPILPTNNASKLHRTSQTIARARKTLNICQRNSQCVLRLA